MTKYTREGSEYRRRPIDHGGYFDARTTTPLHVAGEGQGHLARARRSELCASAWLPLSLACAGFAGQAGYRPFAAWESHFRSWLLLARAQALPAGGAPGNQQGVLEQEARWEYRAGREGAATVAKDEFEGFGCVGMPSQVGGF